jgi:hypothetical protein
MREQKQNDYYLYERVATPRAQSLKTHRKPCCSQSDHQRKRQQIKKPPIDIRAGYVFDEKGCHQRIKAASG